MGNMKNLDQTIIHSIEIKPVFGEACNHCGYCCLTEVCSVGVEFTGSMVLPCRLLTETGGKYYCKLVEAGAGKVLGIGAGCCSETQQEVINRYYG